VPDRATACGQWAGNPVGARGLAALLPAAAAAAAGGEPAGPRANPGRLEDAEEPGKGEDAEEEGDDDTDLRPLMADKDDGISCELGIRYPMLQAILSGDKNRQTIQAGAIEHAI